jgi:hypothetical protein
MAVEDFSQEYWVETDLNNHIRIVGTNHVDFLSFRSEDAYFRRDMGVGHFTDFTHKIDVKLNSAAYWSQGQFWMLSNDVDDALGLYHANKSFIDLNFYNDGHGTIWMGLEEFYWDDFYKTERQYYNGYGISVGTPYYCTISKSGLAFTCKVYGDQARTNLLFTLNLTLHEDTSKRYIFVCNTWNSGHDIYGDLSIENLDMQEEGVTEAIAVYAFDRSTNQYMSGVWGTASLDGVPKDAIGGRVLWPSVMVGAHTLSLVAIPAGYSFAHWKAYPAENWKPPTIDNPYSTNINITTQSGGPNGLVVYLTLEPPKIATSISINVSPTSGIVPFVATVTGNLVDSSGFGLQGKSINLYVNATLVDTQITGSEGNYVFDVNITAAGTFQCQTEFAGDDTFEWARSQLITVIATISPLQITLNIGTSGNGTVNLPNGPHTFNVGDTVQFTATEGANSAFSQWTLNGTIYTTNPLNLQIMASMDGLTLVAVFILTTINLTVTAGANGSVDPSGTIMLSIGQDYQFTATPDSNYQVDHWELAGANIGTTNPMSITAVASMDGLTLTVLFTNISPAQITIQIAVTGNGTTTPAVGTHIFNVGDSIQFSATPNNNSSFTDWKFNGASYTDNPLALTITQEMDGKTLTAEFTAIVTAGFPYWILLIIGGGVAVSVYALSKKKKRP